MVGCAILGRPEDPRSATKLRRDTAPDPGRHRMTSLSLKLYVGNLAFSSTQEDIEGLFTPHGAVASVNVITDRDTGRPRGFAFVEMEDADSARQAIRALDGATFDGRPLKVNEAQARQAGRPGSRF